MEKFEEKIQIEKIDINNIPENILGIKLTEEERNKLSKGLYSDMHENLRIDANNIVAGKFKLVTDKNNEISVHLVFRKEKLLIPDEFEFNGKKKKLNTHEKECLLKNETICLDNNVFLKIDKDTNSIIFTNTKNHGIPDEIGGYKLTSEDKAALRMGQGIKKVLKNEKNYFTSTISINNEKMIFSNCEYVQKGELKEKLKEFNNSKNINQSVEKKEIKKENNIITQTILFESIDKKNFKKINEIKDSNYKLSEEDRNYIKNSKNLTEEEKNVMITIFEDKKSEIKISKKEGIENVKEKVDVKEKSKTNNKSKIERVITNAFSDM